MYTPILPFALLACLSALAPATAQGARPYLFKPGKWSRQHVPKDWVVYTSRHYQIQSQVGKEKAKRLARHMEAMLVVYMKMFRPENPSGFKKRPIKLFKDRKTFLQYGETPGAAAFYSRVDREMVCYDTGKWADEETEQGSRRAANWVEISRRYRMDLLGVIAHEGWHQYFHWYVVSMVSLPSWINEGMGDYFYTARPTYKKGKASGKAILGRLNETRLPLIRLAVKHDAHVPIKQILRYAQGDYYANAGICYAEGWALCQFLLHSGNKRYARVIPRFIRLVKDDSNFQTVTARAFKGIDLDKLEQEWKAWVLQARLPREIEEEQLPKKGR